MPKTSLTGAFSDLYDLMQERKTSPSPQQTSLVTKSPSPFVTMSPKGQKDKTTSHHVALSPNHQGGKVTTVPVPVEDTLTEREYFRCSIEEVEAIEELKTKLRRDHGIKTSKQDLERHAVRRMIEDYKQLGEKSYVVTKLRTAMKRWYLISGFREEARAVGVAHLGRH